MEKYAKLFIICIVAALLQSCGTTKTVTQYKEVPVEVYKTVARNVVSHDSIYIHDSIFTVSRADTVFQTKYRTKYVERIKNDTIRDTIQVPVTINSNTETVVTKTKIPFTNYALITILGIVVFLLIMHILKTEGKS